MIKRKEQMIKLDYLVLIKSGVPEKELPHLCEQLQIGIDIDQPFSKENIIFIQVNEETIEGF